MPTMNQKWMLTLAVALVFGVGACSSQAPGTKPDDMSADEHLQHANKHEKMSEEHGDHYNPGAGTTRREASLSGENDVFYPVEVYNPTEHHRDVATSHQRHAEQHRQAAQKLLSYEDNHCARFPAETRSSCPLMGQIKAVEDIDGGVRMTFHDGVPLQATVDHMKCHFAVARTEGYEGMPTCPLYLEGLSVETADDGKSVTLTTDTAEAVEPLRKRARKHL
ncbi:MAG: hypothetical protein ACNA8W_17455 [Bradymonadaceae bacterium]